MIERCSPQLFLATGLPLENSANPYPLSCLIPHIDHATPCGYITNQPVIKQVVNTAAPLAPPKRERRKQHRPGELLDAALDLFVEKGYAATRSEEVAAKAGVSKGTL